ncbi:MAG: hypothetical protein AB1351_02125 [Thermoproteota archaeon]
MNPHKLFVSMMLASFGFIGASMAASGEIGQLFEMAKIAGIMAASIVAVLYATRKYWRGARRLD